MEKTQCSQEADKIVNIANTRQTTINADTVNVIIQQSDRLSPPATDADPSLRPYITNTAKTRYVLDDYGDEEEFEFYPDRLYVLSLYFITLSTGQEQFEVMDYVTYAPLTKNGKINDDVWSVPYTLCLIDLQGQKVRKVREIKNVYEDALKNLTPTLETLEKDLFYNLGIAYKELTKGHEYIEYRRSMTEPDKMRCNYVREFYVKTVDSTGIMNLVDPECLHQHRYLPFSTIDNLPKLDDGLYRFLDKPLPCNISDVLFNDRRKLISASIQISESDIAYQSEGVLFKLALSNAYDVYKASMDKGNMDQLLIALFEKAMMWGNIGKYVISGNEVVGVLPYGTVNIASMLERLFRGLEKAFSIVCLRCTAVSCKYSYGKTLELSSRIPSFSGKGYEKLLHLSHETHMIQLGLPKNFHGILFGTERNDPVRFASSESHLYKDYEDNATNKSMQFTYIKY